MTGDVHSLALPIATTRLLLREYRPGDAASVFAYASDAEVTRHLPWGPSVEIAESIAFVERAARLATEQPRQTWVGAIERRADGLLIGSIELRLHRPWEADIGYGLRRDAWGRGFASEAAQALLNAAFAQLRLHRLYATVSPDNPASVRVLEKLGLRREGRLRDHQLVRGGWRDSLLFAVLEDEWRARGVPG